MAAASKTNRKLKADSSKKKAKAKKPTSKKTAPKKKTGAKSASKKTVARRTPRAKTSPKTATPKKKSASKKAVAKKAATKKPSVKKSSAKRAGAHAATTKSSTATAAETSTATAPPKKILAPRRVSKGKMLPRSFLLELSDAIRQAVVPAIESGKGREIVGNAASGDATFELDQLAEKALLSFLRVAKMPVAYYSEDSGYTTFTSGQPTNLLIVDPIDGTRAAKNGFEGCTVSVSTTRVIERPTLADLDNACVVELLSKRAFYAEKDGGARVMVDGHTRKIRLSENKNLETISWAMTVPARPAELIFPTAAKLIDLSSLKGGFFACNSTSYSLTRLLTGQLDCCVDFANRYYRDIPSIVEDSFINAGRGVVLGVCPYDFAGAALIAMEAGCTVTDAYGNDFDDVLLLDSSVTNHRSLIAAANAELHEKLLSFFDTRIEQFEALLKNRAR